VNSAGGLVISLLNRLPEAGDVVEIGGVQMRVETVRDRAVATILLCLPAAVADREGTS
jgi:Mg2+/Co2+ transporter CorC